MAVEVISADVGGGEAVVVRVVLRGELGQPAKTEPTIPGTKISKIINCTKNKI